MTKNPRDKRPGLLHPVSVGRRPFDTINIYYVGPFVTTPEGYKYILVMVDNLPVYGEEHRLRAFNRFYKVVCRSIWAAL